MIKYILLKYADVRTQDICINGVPLNACKELELFVEEGILTHSSPKSVVMHIKPEPDFRIR